MRPLDRLSTNPVFRRLAPPDRFPSPAAIAGLGLGLCLASALAVPLAIYRLASGRPTSLIFIAMAVAWALMYFSPPLAARQGATLAARDTQTEEFTLLRLTTLSDRTIVLGYLATALYRLRLLYTIMAGLSPVFVGSIVISLLAVRALLNAISLAAPGINVFTTMAESALIVQTLMLVFVAASLWGLNVAGAATGVWLGLWWRVPYFSATGASLAISLLVIPPALLVILPIPPAIRLAIAASYAALAWALSYAVMRLAEGAVRQEAIASTPLN